MACGKCGRAANGDVIIYQYIAPSGATEDHASKVDADIARARNGGRGTIIKTTKAAAR